ncbi:MAG: tetratricopeptide repeat protein [Rikenellaceae bacterium]|nr:tetratricopeptide repeat protein [Rikenellaceae bacterium]
MPQVTMIDNAIQILSAAIDESPNDFTLFMERSKLYHQKGNFDKALNDFIHASEINPDSQEADSYIEIISEILNYRYKDIYNP